MPVGIYGSPHQFKESIVLIELPYCPSACAQGKKCNGRKKWVQHCASRCLCKVQKYAVKRDWCGRGLVGFLAKHFSLGMMS